MRARRVAFAAVVAAAILAGGFLWASAGIARLTASIFGSPIMPSTSLAPYEILLRTAFGATSTPLPEGVSYEWKLVIPRAFLVSEIGINGETYRANNKKNNRWYDSSGTFRGDSFFAHLHLVLTSPRLEPKPAVFASAEELRDSFIGITIANNRLFPESSFKNYCVKDDDVDLYFKGQGSAISRKTCPSAMPRCNINTIADGWTISISTSRLLYNEPEKVCRLAHDFLNEYTNKRDAIN